MFIPSAFFGQPQFQPKGRHLYQKFKNFDITHKSNDEKRKKLMFKTFFKDQNSQFLSHQPPLGSLNGLKNDWTKFIYSIFSFENVVELLGDSIISVTSDANYCWAIQRLSDVV